MSLYWYGRNATGMPLLQFLAYYQVIEFYMPTYSNQEALGKVRKIVKDPRFSPEKDSQVARILAALKASARGFGDEKSQLEAVMRQCLSSDELRKFYEESDERKQFYEKDYKTVAPQKIPLGSQTSDLVPESAHRLYEIRCRIVHTKDSASERELPPLLPFSKEAGDLYFDIQLVRFVATEVLIAASSDFRT